MLRHLLVPLALAVGAVPTAAQAVPEAAAARPADPTRDRIVSTLTQLRVTLEFQDTPLAEAVEFIRQIAKLNILIDGAVTERHGKDGPKVTMKVKDLPLGSALKLMLESQGLTLLYRDQVLLVVTEDRAKQAVVLQVYDVRDLLMRINHFPGPEICLEPIRGVTPEMPPDPPGEITADYVVNAIRTTCGKASWDENPKVSIEENNGLLVVTQSPEVHRQIRDLLRLLRANK